MRVSSKFPMAWARLMIEGFQALHPMFRALLATIFTWATTALEAAGVFIARDISSSRLRFDRGAKASTSQV